MAMALDPTKLQDWQIADEAEKSMKPVSRLATDWGILEKELLPYGRDLGKVEYAAVLERLQSQPNGKYIDVTAITPTPLGEGKSTTTMGLVQGLAKGESTYRAQSDSRQAVPRLISKAPPPAAVFRSVFP